MPAASPSAIPSSVPMAKPGSERMRLAPICWYSSSEPSAAKKCLRISMGLRTYSGSPHTHSSCHRPTRHSSKPALARRILDGNIAFYHRAVDDATLSARVVMRCAVHGAADVPHHHVARAPAVAEDERLLRGVRHQPLEQGVAFVARQAGEVRHVAAD